MVLRALETERAFGMGVLKNAGGRCIQTGEPVQPPQPLTLEQRLTRAEQLTEKGRGEEALAMLDAITEGKDKVLVPRSQKARFLHLRGVALFRMRTRYAEAAKVLQAASMMTSDTAEDDAFNAARAIARSDQNVRSAKAMRAFAKRYPKRKRVAEALYLAAWLELRVDHKGAEQALNNWLDGPHAATEPGLAAEARVELGMRALHQGKHAVAAQRFAAYASMAKGCLERGRGLYWGARAELEQKNKAQAVVQLNEAAATEPLCWYALLARKVLSELGEPMPPAYPSEAAQAAAIAMLDPDASVALDAAVDAQAPPIPVAEAAAPAAAEAAGVLAPSTNVAVALPKDVAFYAALGFDGDAVAALRSEESSVRASAPPGFGLQALVNAYVALGEHARPRALVHLAPAGLLTRAPSPETAFAMRAAYARPHRALVQELAASDQVEEDLIYAVMLKESAFDPRVMSNADAIGLMQLCPARQMVGRELGLTVTRRTLLDPHDNIRLGVRLLRQLMFAIRRADGLGWRRTTRARIAWTSGSSGRHARGRGQRAFARRFVEDIPMTRPHYVRRVLAF